MGEIALRVDGLGKKYEIQHKDHDHITLAQAALHRIRHPRGARSRESLWALTDVSFEVRRGEVLGVIGHNGAGKSTLLKILSRITTPTTGRVEVFGRLGSLLEVGTGFHPELTGRENIFLNGSILGMRKKEIERQFGAIVDFSGVGQFLDTPVKRYSSGMYVRLAFAVAAHLDTEILLLDEVLAVGDATFQTRASARIQQLVNDGRTVVLVSHQLATITELASRVLVMKSGVIELDERTDLAVAAYRDNQPVAYRPPDITSKTDDRRLARILSASCILQGDDAGDQNLEIQLTIQLNPAVTSYRINTMVRSFDGRPAASAFGPEIPTDSFDGTVSSLMIIRTSYLAEGTYVVDLSCDAASGVDQTLDLADFLRGSCRFDVPLGQRMPWPSDGAVLHIGGNQVSIKDIVWTERGDEVVG